jgi:hypothetical protein
MIVPKAAIQDRSTRFIQDCAIQVDVGQETAHVIVRRQESHGLHGVSES